MDRKVAIFGLPFLLASILYETTLAETECFRVDWTKENSRRWFPIGTIFYDGDSLEFVFNQTNYNVVVVDKLAFETCKAPEGAFEYNSGDDTVPLKKGENYFICTKRGCCENNMKMMIDAAAGQRPTKMEETEQVRSGQDNQVKSWVKLIGICYMVLFF